MFVDTILILDDDTANLQGIAGVLRSEPYSVLEASTGPEALEKAKTGGRISLLVTDMDLTDSCGTDIALKLVGLYPNLPVLFISGTPKFWWTRRDVSNFRQFWMNSVDFLEKPFSAKRLPLLVKGIVFEGERLKVERETQLFATSNPAISNWQLAFSQDGPVEPTVLPFKVRN